MRRFALFQFAAALAALACSDNCAAYRPFTTEDAGVAGKGVPQLELSWDYLSWKHGDHQYFFLAVPIYGVTENLELSAEIPYLVDRPRDEQGVDGIGDTNLVAKYAVFKETGMWPAFTFKGVVKTDSGSSRKSLGSGDIDYSLVAVASKSLGPFMLHANLGYTFVGDNGDPNIRNVYLYGFALDYALSDPFHLVAEIVGNRNPNRRVSDDQATGLVGATYRLSEKIILDAAVRFGVNDSVPEWSTTTGVSLVFQ